ncbi:hypothetical protein JOF56_003373 [Kibdelosporangium banguiense]|uniref:Pentapeptide repeat-containing protein n=1 Tax=Kibdelosporangium banguiense TaxID=1365924 RepID=A0ABS4TGJ1_9PSEU|nr:pentapeptide repeat-containing protein [Kibdelosporangium banguiense]MBP2322988.1 hypothetical protein [Kibdelosporangium banguiense]
MDSSNRRVAPPVVSHRGITGIATTIALLTAAIVTALWWIATRGLNGEQLVAARFDALKIGLSVGAGSGGLFALYLAWQRQRSTEADLERQERVASDTRADATERRITDLYTKAVEQLGSDKAPVRMGGLYALERLAQDYRVQRQTIVNVFCAYLRMPYVLPGVEPTDDAEDRQRTQELEVRRTAQDILCAHLRDLPRDPDNKFWAEMKINLSGAHLIALDLKRCQAQTAQFKSALFTGTASFDSSVFTEYVSFESAIFTDEAVFRATAFRGNAFFGSARFRGNASFASAKFAGSGMFESAVFERSAVFKAAVFGNTTNFERVTFARGTPPEIKQFLP